MRQRKPKDLDKKIESSGSFLVRDPGPRTWKECFPPGDIYLEIGCGKGDFILAKAMDNRDKNYLAIEGQDSVILRALEKAMFAESLIGGGEAAGSCLCNLRFTCVYVKSMKDLFEESSLSGIYLNFSDPWPKKRHYKRRLTWRGRLSEYAWALKDGGFMEIKTDNDDLFDFTLEEIAACGWRPAELSRDLHSSDYEARNTVTEYEKKFMGTGKNINYVKVLPR